MVLFAKNLLHSAQINKNLQIVCKKSLINWFNEKSGAKLDKQISLSLEDLSKEYRSGQIEKGKKITTSKK